MKRWSVPAALGAALVALAAPARADQCALVQPAVAQRALAAVQQHERLVTFCEPCGDAAPGEPAAVTSVRVGSDAAIDSMEELWVDGAPIDLAYAYVQTSPARYDNLAALAGCPTTGVSPGLDVAREPDGVLITASAKPIAVAAASAPAPAPAPVAPPAVITVPIPEVIAPPAQIVMVPAPDDGWGSPLLVALGGAACASAGWLAWLLLVMRRRERGTFKPRALGLGRDT